MAGVRVVEPPHEITATVFNKQMDWMEQQFVPAAEAMPEDKFF